MSEPNDIKSPEYRESELSDLAGVFDEPATDPKSTEPPVPAPSGESDEPAEAAKEEPKKDEPKPAETEGKAWKAIRRRQKDQDAREAKLAAAEAAIKANESAIADKVSRAERTLSLVERANDGDPDAWVALGLDIEKANAAFLKNQTGESRIERLEKRQEELAAKRKQDEDDAKKRREEAEEAARAEHAKAEVWGLAEKVPYFAKKGPAKTIELCEYVAQDWVNQGRRFTFAELVSETHRRVMAALEEDAASLGYTKPAAPPPPPPKAPITRRDTGERGGPSTRPYSKEAELDEISSLFD